MGWIIALNFGGWLVIQLGLAWVFTHMPEAWFDRAWRRHGRRRAAFYERAFHIKQWKSLLPDGGLWVGGRFTKHTLARKDSSYLRSFIAETWRGELCHWLAMACVPVFFLWNPWWGDVIIIAYAVLANLPCILVQRYNRLRLVQLRAKCGDRNAGPPLKSR
jgi:glycosyl-4,4'-diaponeurosporenoate acyltransferase